MIDSGGQNSFKFIKSTDTKYLVINTKTNLIRLINLETHMCSELLKPTYSLSTFVVLNNGNVIMMPSSSHSIFYLFDSSLNTINSLGTYGYNYSQIIEFDNGNALLASPTHKCLLYFNDVDDTVKVLLREIVVTEFKMQEDGTCLINTEDGFDYEYNPETDTMRLVYTVEQE